jgi:hypothetical protein
MWMGYSWVTIQKGSTPLSIQADETGAYARASELGPPGKLIGVRQVEHSFGAFLLVSLTGEAASSKLTRFCSRSKQNVAMSDWEQAQLL